MGWSERRGGIGFGGWQEERRRRIGGEKVGEREAREHIFISIIIINGGTSRISGQAMELCVLLAFLLFALHPWLCER